MVIVTDRDELDKQIERIFTEAGEAIYRTSSGRDLIRQLGQARPRLLCSLVHKFGRRDVEDFDAFIKELESQPSQTVGEVFVFVDECHRTQNTELAKKPRECLEYIVVHEMIHILEPTHNARFAALMDQCMPQWQCYREQLNRLPVRHEDWAC